MFVFVCRLAVAAFTTAAACRGGNVAAFTASASSCGGSGGGCDDAMVVFIRYHRAHDADGGACHWCSHR